MEQSAEVEENQQKSSSLPSPKPSGSLIRIDAISINLAAAMDNPQDASPCDHFSIREYVAEMREKNISVCLPFPIEDDNNLEEQKSLLPALDVVKFKWWSCHNCLGEIGAEYTAKGIVKVPDTAPTGSLSEGPCSIKEHFIETTGGATNVACMELNRKENLISFRDYNIEKNNEVGQSIADGSENDAYHQMFPITKDIISSTPVSIPERHVDDSGAFERNTFRNMELCESSFRGTIPSNIRHLERNDNSSTAIDQTRISNAPNNDQRMDTGNCETRPNTGAFERNTFRNMELCESSFRGTIPSNIRHLENNDNSSTAIDRTRISKAPNNEQRMETGYCETRPNTGTVSIEARNFNKGKEKISQSVDDLSSEGSDRFAKNVHQVKFEDSSSKTVRQRPPKVRLLAELLGSGGNAENDQSRTTDSADSGSDFCDDMAAQTIAKKLSKGKRKITHDENGNPPLLSKKTNVSKGNAKLAKRNCMVIDSETEESCGTFIQPKNLNNHALSKKKHKQTHHEGGSSTLMPRPDVSKKHHLAATEGGPSRPAHHMLNNTETDTCDKRPVSRFQAERQLNTSKKKNKQIGTWVDVPVPQWSTTPGEGLCVRKDSDAYGEKDVGLSLSRNEETRRAKNTVDVEPLSLMWNSSLREGNSDAGESSVVRKSAPGLGSGKGLLCDLNEKIASPSHTLDVQNAFPRFAKGTVQHDRELNMLGSHNNDPETNDHDKGNDDIPMEIVELMAKNQYDRRRHEYERTYFSQERANGKGKFEQMGSSSIHKSGLLKSYQVEDHSVRNPISQTTMHKSSELLIPINSFSHINETHLNMSSTEGKRSVFARCNSFFDYPNNQSGRVSYADSGSIIGGNYQNYLWQSGYIGSSFSPKFGYPTVPNYMNLPTNYLPQASNFGTSSQIAESSSHGGMTKSLDLNFVNDQYKNFQKQNTDIGFESFSNASNPFASKHRGFDLNATASGSLDLQSNEAIPALQLLSLMDAGMKSSNVFNPNENPKMISKPFPFRDNHSEGPDKPILFPDYYNSKGPFGRVIGVPSNSSIPSSSSSYGKSQWRKNSREFPPPIPAFGRFPSPFQHGSYFQGANGTPIGVPLKFGEKNKGPARNSAHRLQNFANKTGLLLNNQGTSSQKGLQYTSGSMLPIQSLPGTESCCMNRNPAEFSVPEPGNKYMINGEDLKFEKKGSYRGKKSSTNVDVKKRQGVTVPTAPNMQ